MTINHSGLERPQAYERVTSAPTRKPQYVQDPVAVVGMACRLPGDSNSPHALWEFLERGGCAHNEVPESRFNLRGHHDGSKRPKTMRSPGGMFLENIDPQEFDAQFFEISRTDAIAMDPQQRQLLEVVYECLENAGIRMEELNGASVGCFVGSYAVGMAKHGPYVVNILEAHRPADYSDIMARDPEDRAPSITVGVGRAILSNRISHFFNLKGPSMTIDTACSGSLVSVDVACRYLQSREINGAIVAASNIYLSPEHNMDSGAMKGASSLSGRCHTFDVKADGYIKAEGVNAVILKRLDDAIRDHDPIRAVIRGSSTNSDGRTPGIASPSSDAQALAIRAAYANAGIGLEGTTYLECHGTGTQAGDPTEVSGVASVFSETRTFDDPLIIGSIKSNIGHSEPAAGISGLLKTILSIEKGVIPGTPTFITPNPKIDFHTLKVRASRTALPWPKTDFRRASVNSFGYGGSNAHVVLEEPKRFLSEQSSATFVSSYVDKHDSFFDDDDTTSVRPYTLVFSANDADSLQASTKAIRKHLANPNVKIKLPDLAYTLSERRSHHFHRAYIVAQNLDLKEADFIYGKKATECPRIGFIFTGQGAQWSQMGRELVKIFPAAELLLKHLDDVLQSTPNPPSWSILKELSEPRSPDILRSPEFSQPLVTALQLVLLAILDEWGVVPQAVVGHSSGEIAAAYAAGYITKEDAIKAAFYRGQAAKRCKADSQTPVGMLAVGLGPDKASEYLQTPKGIVQIACFNSPNSVTLSGTVAALEDVKARMVEDGHFARLLQVSLAYHSTFMAEIGEDYENLLHADFESFSSGRGSATMFSSVYGHQMKGPTDVHYWKSNMVSPVLFDQAVRGMVSGKAGANFLIEIGPTGALASPVKQIIAELSGQGANVQYCTSFSRGQDSVKSLYDMAGRLFLSGSDFKLGKLNEDPTSTDDASPSVIVDLPNYSWNHSTRYWYENESSKDWRFRLFPHHDLLGSKVLGTSWQTPSWKKTLQLENLPWLKDHKMGADVIFPAAGFMAMAVEAISQRHQALSYFEGENHIERPRFEIRDVTFDRALVLEEAKDQKIMTTLQPFAGARDGIWHEFVVSSLSENRWNKNSAGLIRIEEQDKTVAPQDLLKPLTHTTPGRAWYKSMNDAGYGFGPMFQKQIEVESTSGLRESRSIVSLIEPESDVAQSEYPMHPACIDGCLQTSAASLWNGNRAAVNAVLVPAIIDEVIITSQDSRSRTGLSVTSSSYVGLGRREETKSYMSHVTVYRPDSGALLFKVSGLRYHKLDTREDPYAAHRYSHLTWKPDITHLTQHGLLSHVSKASDTDLSSMNDHHPSVIDEVIDMIAHKNPNLKVMEINMIPEDATSLWLEDGRSGKSIRISCSEFQYVSADATALIAAQDKYSNRSNTSFGMFEAAAPTDDSEASGNSFGLVIVRLPMPAADFLLEMIRKVQRLLADGGQMLLLEEKPSVPDTVVVDAHSQVCDDLKRLEELLGAHGFGKVMSVPCDQSEIFRLASLSMAQPRKVISTSHPPIDLVRFTSATEAASEMLKALKGLGWQITERVAPFDKIRDKGIILVLDELSSALLPKIRRDQWTALQNLTQLGSRLLWVTKGSQFNVTDPDRAMIHGLFRTVRAEDPSLSLTTLDVENSCGDESAAAIDNILKTLCEDAPMTHVENEFVERGGIIHVSRILPDHLVNQAENEDRHGADLQVKSLHDEETCIRLRCEQLGSIDSLKYAEVSSQPLPVPDGCVEVELVTAGLNFKDVAITMGIVPENEYLLGLEGAGTISRIGQGVQQFKLGQRVVVFEKGTFGNRVIATTERTYAIPDSMTFEEAATLPSVYLTAIYSIFDLANTKKGHRCLIHSASGGLGIASIQLCQFIGAEVFATVGTEEKKKFLMENFGIPSTNIFNSRSKDFGSQLMKATKGYGVDVVLNSLTGDLLDQSWRCIATGGTMIELGKKDMLDRNLLAMEPFGRNASFRCFDMSHKHVSDALIARLLNQLMDLIEKGHVKPIHPITTFPFEDISSAFRFMRGASHMGKIVITNGSQHHIEVPVRPVPRQLELRGDVSYLIIGGLRGLCGSLAIYMARLGAKHLVVMSRSGADDKISQGVLKNIYNEGCEVDLFKGDVSSFSDVRKAFKEASAPVGGIIQGAMVLRDKLYTSMTIEEYHETISSKVQGTWNLHNVAIEENRPLDFFTMLSSISGVVGQKGQANYAAANVFLDNFAAYRQRLGLAACCVDLGAIEDVGYMSEHTDLLVALDTAAWTRINEPLFHKIVRFSIIQQVAPINKSSSSQLITSIAIPQQENSQLLRDARFGGLYFGGSASDKGDDGSEDGSKEIKALFLMLKSGAADPQVVIDTVTDVVNKQFMKTLRLSEPMEPGKPLSSYGLDSLAAVEFRNWVRMELKAELTTLDITNSASLVALCDKIVSKMQSGGS